MRFLLKVLRIFILEFFVYSVEGHQDYCSLCSTHTLCKYEPGPSAKCLGYRKVLLTPEIQQYIVDVHNDIRNYVASGQENKGALGGQPPAANMLLMQWDNELADIAQRWADQCIQIGDTLQHDVCKKTTRFDVGQNILTAVTTDTNLPELAILILNWYKQVQNVIPSDIDMFLGIRRGKFLIGQYTQLVWAETQFVGCGLAVFQDVAAAKNGTQVFLHRFVCNYGPRGNLIGASVYRRGMPCTHCPYGKCDSARPNLCTGLKDKEDNSPMKEPETVIYDGHKIVLQIPRQYFKTYNMSETLKRNFTGTLKDTVNKMVMIFNPDEKEFDTNKQITITSTQRSAKIPTKFGSLKTRAKLPVKTPTTTSLPTKKFTTLVYAEIPRETTLNFIDDYEHFFEPSVRGKYRKYNAARGRIANILHQGYVVDSDYEYSAMDFHPKGRRKEGQFEIFPGKIVLDDCAKHEREITMLKDKFKVDDSVVLPNKKRLRRVLGKWTDGKCKCVI